jgi:hypothetical protein
MFFNFAKSTVDKMADGFRSSLSTALDSVKAKLKEGVKTLEPFLKAMGVPTETIQGLADKAFGQIKQGVTKSWAESELTKASESGTLSDAGEALKRLGNEFGKDEKFFGMTLKKGDGETQNTLTGTVDAFKQKQQTNFLSDFFKMFQPTTTDSSSSSKA